jgi:hypothetical protein
MPPYLAKWGLAMPRDSFHAWRRRSVALGQRDLADTIRRLVYRVDPQLFDRLDFADDDQFLHPLLFAFFTDPSPPIELPQIIYGLIDPLRRPELIQVRTDAFGCLCLGPIGDIQTAVPSGILEFGRVCPAAPYACLVGEKPVPFKLHPPLYVPGTRIQVVHNRHPLLERFAPICERTDVDIVQTTRYGISHLLLALGLLQTYCQDIWAEVVAVTRLIVLFRAPQPNSFATLSAHGAIFCNLAYGDDEIALLEDVTHQAAHVSFNALTHNPSRILAIDPETPMQVLCNQCDDVRSVYAAFHGLFTYTLICRALASVYDNAVLPEYRSHELSGRLGFTLEKFAVDVQRLDLPGAYTAIGRRCYEAFSAEYHKLHARYSAALDGFDFGNQPYVFSYARFVERNAGSWPCPQRPLL